MEQYNVTGMSCAACQARVEKAVSAVPGVESVSVSLLTNTMGVEGSASCDAVISAVQSAGYGASKKGVQKESVPAPANFVVDEIKQLKKRLVTSLVFLAVLMYITMGVHMLDFPLPDYLSGNCPALALTQLLLAATVMIINGKFFKNGFGALLHGAPNMDTLVALGSSVSFFWSVIMFYVMLNLQHVGESITAIHDIYYSSLYFESAAMIPALITVGKLLEAVSKGKTTNALNSLISLAPKTAHLVRDGIEVEVPVSEVTVGDVFAVRPGDSIPVDGVVLTGESAIDEAMLTGESIPADKTAGDTVSAATINKSGYLTCRATRVGEDTTLSQIIHMVMEASATKAPIARIADRVSGVFVPVVMFISMITFFGWILFGQTLTFALARAISVLVISCPCALGLATPVAIMVGNGLGAKNGILFKTGEALESAGKVKVIAMDKTGTVTVGEPEVTDLLPAEGTAEDELLLAAYALEQKSEHPLAHAVVKAAEKRALPAQETEGFQILPGNGLSAVWNNAKLSGGSLKYMQGFVNIPSSAIEQANACAAQGKTPLLFAKDNSYLGMIAVADTIRSDTQKAISQLKNLGITVVMLTGDNEQTAKAIADKAGISHVIAGVLPEDKAKVVRALSACGKTAMVGDGINDAPALTEADLGIAIGAGTDVAIDSADIVLMNSSLTDVATAVRLSKKTLWNIYENLFWAFFYNAICIPLAAGLFSLKLHPMAGAAAMSLSSFTVCMNALRLNLYKLKNPDRDKGTPPPDSAVQSVLNTIKLEKERKNKMQKTVKIKGMMCGHCEATVKKALEALSFIESAQASHEKEEAIITLSGELQEDAVKQAITDKDFTFVEIL